MVQPILPRLTSTPITMAAPITTSNMFWMRTEPASVPVINWVIIVSTITKTTIPIATVIAPLTDIYSLTPLANAEHIS